jgi:hypothetical protein
MAAPDFELVSDEETAVCLSDFRRHPSSSTSFHGMSRLPLTEVSVLASVLPTMLCDRQGSA